jgi:tetratricopeptide (TPR) repeat protein
MGVWIACAALWIRALASPPQSAPAQELKAAAAAEKAGQYLEAAEHYQRFLAMEPPASSSAAAKVRVRMATDQFMAHRYKDSLKSLQPALALKTRLANPALAGQAWMVAGLDELQLNRLNVAIADLEQALKLNPESGTARLALGDALARSGHFADAVAEYSSQAQRTPKQVEAWYKLGVAEAQFSKQTWARLAARRPLPAQAAMLAGQRSLERGDGFAAAKLLLPFSGAASSVPPDGRAQSEPALPGINAALGQAFLDEGDIKAAQSEFRKELLFDSESVPAWFGLAQTDALDLEWNSLQARLRHLMLFHSASLERCLEIEPPAALKTAWRKDRAAMPAGFKQTAGGRLWKSWLDGNGASSLRIETSKEDDCPQLPEAAASVPGAWLTDGCYQRLVRKLNDQQKRGKALNAQQRAKLAEAKYRLGRYNEAQGDAERLLQDDPRSSWGAYWLVQAAQALSFQALARAAALNPDSPRIHQMLAENAADHYQWKQAIAEYQEALRLAPGLTDLHFGLGTAYWQAGSWKQAEIELRKTLELSPASTVAAFELGDSEVEQHQWRNAIPCLTKALANPALARQARLDLAKAEAALGYFHQALAELEPAAQDDGDGEIHFRLASLYRKVGDYEKARAALAESERLRRASDAMTVERTEQMQRERARLEQAEKQESHP